MGKLKTEAQYDAAMREILTAHSLRTTFTTGDAFDILEKHGMDIVDVRLLEVLDSLPVGLEDLIEDEEDE